MDGDIHTLSSTPGKPQVTSSNSREYCHCLADVSSRACFTDPINIVFSTERGGAVAQPTLDDIYNATLFRIEAKAGLGCLVVEADNFAAVACWEPPEAVPPNHTVEELEEMAKDRPIYAEFFRAIETARDKCLGESQKCWQLSLMARDPLITSKGAVRGVIEPFVKRAKDERLPIWCIAGNERARDVYAYFGFRVVELVYSGKEKIKSWCMVCNWPTE